MIREEAIKVIQELIDIYIRNLGDESVITVLIDNVDVEALFMALHYLSIVPCEDAISRKEAIDSFKPKGLSDEAWEACALYKKLNALPSVMPKQNTMHWIKHEWAEEYNGRLIPNYECSRCHSWFRNDSHCCPDCGAQREDKA